MLAVGGSRFYTTSILGWPVLPQKMRNFQQYQIGDKQRKWQVQQNIIKIIAITLKYTNLAHKILHTYFFYKHLQEILPKKMQN